VTCYTCHRGNQVPQKLWWSSTPINRSGLTLEKSATRLPTPAAGASALPNDALTDYLLHDNPVRMIGTQALAGTNRNSIWHARDTYSLMMVMSESLGVNCDFCHNTRAFAAWELSTPQRVTAWYGIRMVRDLNNSVELTLKGTLPPDRLGPNGDVPKIYCATCHQGSNKPLYGAPMLQYYPELVRPQTADASAPQAAPVAEPPPAPVAPAATAVKTAQARQPLILVNSGS
jgi:photosynthetic reaction center cytochrome c subunit